MRQPDIPKKPNLNGWLWWLALVIAATGWGVSYVLRLDTMNPDLNQQLTLTFLLSFAGVGICVISATANWWMHH